MTECPTCNGSGTTPCAMDLCGPNHRPARVRYGRCPVCQDGSVCPRCLHVGGMDDDDAGLPKCRFCGWSAAVDASRHTSTQEDSTEINKERARAEKAEAAAYRAEERARLAEEWRDHDKARAEAAEAERDRLRFTISEVLEKLDRDGMKPGWGVVRDWLRAALRNGEDVE